MSWCSGIAFARVRSIAEPFRAIRSTNFKETTLISESVLFFSKQRSTRKIYLECFLMYRTQIRFHDAE